MNQDVNAWKDTTLLFRTQILSASLSLNVLYIVFFMHLQMADDLDVEAMLEAPYRKEVGFTPVCAVLYI